MAVWKIEILDVHGQKETISDYVYAEFTEVLNSVGNFQIVISKSGSLLKFTFTSRKALASQGRMPTTAVAG